MRWWLALCTFLVAGCRCSDQAPVQLAPSSSASSPVAAVSPQIPSSVPSTPAYVASAAPLDCNQRFRAIKGKPDWAKEASLGNACAQGMLAHQLLESARLPEDFAHAAQLAQQALDAGADTVPCVVFLKGIGQAEDPARGAACLERLRAWRELAILYASGTGVPRDLDKARQTLSRKKREPGSEDCTDERIDKILEEAQSNKDKVWDWCDDVVCTTLDTDPCQSQRNLIASWKAATDRKANLDLLGSQALPKYRALETAFQALRAEDANTTYFRYVNGSLRNSFALRRDELLVAQFDRVLSEVASKRPLTTFSAEELRAARKDLRAQEKVEVQSVGGSFSQADYDRLQRKTEVAWSRYVQAWCALALLVLEGEPAALRTNLETLLVRGRLDMIADETP